MAPVLSDAQRPFARRARSRRTVVLGGGLLGLEAARAMQRLNTQVWVIEHAPRLMANQLDDEGAALLQAQVEAAGIRVLTNARVKAVHGHGRVEGVALRGGERIDCDTVVVAAGIQPNVDLALASGLPAGRGIRVDDAVRTADPHIHAIGECAEHRGAVYGIVAPGFEQAAVAVHSLSGGRARYEGSLVATRLKVLDLPVFSMGQLGVAEGAGELRSASHGDAAGTSHRRTVTQRGRLVGALAVGACAEMSRLQEAVLARRRLMPWQLWRFRRSGSLWPAEEATMKMNRNHLALLAALAASAGAAIAAETISPQQMTDALHAVMAADRAVYTKLIVNRLQNEEKLIKASEHWKDDKALVLPAQMFRYGAEEVAKTNKSFSYSLLSTWPVEHYDTVGGALLWTLGAGLGDAFTDDVKTAWTRAYGILAGAMKEAAKAPA